MKEYPPTLSGTPEHQLAQIRDYLVRLNGYIDEIEARADSTAASVQDTLAVLKSQVESLQGGK